MCVQAVGGQVFGHPGGDDESGDQVVRCPGDHVPRWPGGDGDEAGSGCLLWLSGR